MMFHIIFTLDYEIHGNGDGSPYNLMIEPTNRMLKLFDRFGAKLTILADVAEIIKFKEYYEQYGTDDYYYFEIINQLKYAVKTGHDVQLHIHSGYFKSKFENKKWNQDWSEYNLAELPFSRLNEMISQCKTFLENELKEAKTDYKCNVFRAANWSMIPSKNIIKALTENDINIDTSVFKYGKRSKRVKFDYTEAHHEIIPWFADQNNICNEDKFGKMLEIPIYCENRNFAAFITPIRFFRMVRAKFHQHEKFNEDSENITYDSESSNTKTKTSRLQRIIKKLRKKHAWKMDFNQATGKQLIRAAQRIQRKYSNSEYDIPIVLIGHSKSFIKLNEITLRPFLFYIRKTKNCEFSLFNDLKLDSYRSNSESI